jgi:nucleoside-diphosphate-sugar epimerase
MAKAACMTGLFCFGFGFSARALAARLKKKGRPVTGTSRDPDRCAALAAEGWSCLPFDSAGEVAAALGANSHVLVSVPPGELGDPVLGSYGDALIANSPSIRWIGYLSTTAVYGDRGGDWVDETSALSPTTPRGRRRLAAEQSWLALHSVHGLPVHVFRLAGIYGPGRNQLIALRAGVAKSIVKPGQVFSRIHVDDIAGALEASMARPNPGRCYNVCDDEPAPPQDVVAYAAMLLGAAPPPSIPFEEARLAGMSKSFYEESKRVSNRRMKEELGHRLLYPTYREGLLALSAGL